MAAAYPGTLPPPVDYPRARKRRSVAVTLGVLVVVAAAAVATTIVLAQRRAEAPAPSTLTDEAASAAIQDYLDALTDADVERIAEHGSCGLYDALTDNRSDLSLANLASDAFRRQFESARVQSVDKIVEWSPNQAQVLFTMQITPTRRGEADRERQAVAQLLIQPDEVLVCSYLPRNEGPI